MQCIKFAVSIFSNTTGKSKLNFKALAYQQARTFVRDRFPNRVTHYLHRAKLIDSVRLALRSASSTCITSILHDAPLLDSFVLVNAIRCAPSAESAINLIDSLRTTVPKLTDTQPVIHALATVLARHGRRDELKALIGSIEAGKFCSVKVSPMNLMTWYASAGDIDEVLNVWGEYKRMNEKAMSTESYNVLMRLYVQACRDTEAMQVFNQMIGKGAIPNSRTYFVIIDHLARRGKFDASLEVFKVLPSIRIKRTSKMYLVLIKGFVGIERYDEVKFLLREMRLDGIFPGHDMLSSLQMMHEAGFVEEVKELYREMLPNESIKKIGDCEYDDDSDDNHDDDNEHRDSTNNDSSNGRQVHGVQLKQWLDPRALANALKDWNPSEVTALESAKFVWTTRLVCRVLRNFRSPETAWNFFCWVACQPGFNHDIYTVQRMIVLLARHGKDQLVKNLLHKVRNEGMTLPFSTIRLIIEFYGISKNPNAALDVFHNDLSLCGTLSNFNIMLLYSSLLRTLTKCRRDPDVLDILDEMILNRICPDIQTLSGLMYHFALQGDVKTVQRLFAMVRQSGLEPDAYIYKILVQAYCTCERAALAWRVFQDMRNLNLMPDFVTKELLVKSLWKEGKRKEAATVEETYEETINVEALAIQGHIWTLSAADLARVYDIYSNSFTSSELQNN